MNGKISATHWIKIFARNNSIGLVYRLRVNTRTQERFLYRIFKNDLTRRVIRYCENKAKEQKNLLKVQMKCFFIQLPNLKEQQKSGRSPFTVSQYLSYFQIYKGLKRVISGQKVAKKSIKINKICDIMKK